MIKIGILGEIGSGKSYVAINFGYPVFNADYEVAELYKKDKKIFYKLRKILPTYISKFPIDKKEISDEKENAHFAFELHHFGHRYPGDCGPCMRLIFQAHLMKNDDKMQLHISNPEFQTYR